MKDLFNRSFINQGKTFKFHNSVDYNEIVLFKAYMDSPTKPYVQYMGKTLCIRLLGRLTPESKIVRKFINGLLRAKNSPSFNSSGTITVKLQGNKGVKLRDLF